MQGGILSVRAAEVPLAASSVNLRIGVEDFSPAAASRHPDPVVLPEYRREVAGEGDDIVRIADGVVGQ